MRFRAPPAWLGCWHPSAKVWDQGLEFRELVLLACAPLSRVVLAVWMQVLAVRCALQTGVSQWDLGHGGEPPGLQIVPSTSGPGPGHCCKEPGSVPSSSPCRNVQALGSCP